MKKPPTASNAGRPDQLFEQWPWPDSLDGVTAAPQSHRVLMENDQVRVLEVVIEPGTKEPPHTHRRPSVFVVIEASRVLYFGADGNLENELVPPIGPRWFDPQGLHAVENIDRTRFYAIRIELKPPAPRTSL